MVRMGGTGPAHRAAAVLGVLGALLTACTDGGPVVTSSSPGPPSAPASALPSPTPSPSHVATSPSPSPSASVPPATTPAAPDPRSVPVDSLLRPGTTIVRALYGDLDGDGTEEIVLASRDATPPPGAFLAQGYLDVFVWDGRVFARTFGATEGAPPGGGSKAPGLMLQRPDPVAVSQEIDFLALVDLEGDGSAELGVGILNIGAGPGPLDVWVISMPSGSLRTEFYEETVSGGILTSAGDSLRLVTPSYEPTDPACCPSRIEYQTIGFDPVSGRVKVVSRTFTSAG